MSISLEKDKAKVTIDKIGLGGQKAEVLVVIDASGSMSNRYQNGSVQAITEKALALALNFDDDGKVPAVAFDSRTIVLPEVTIANLEGYVDREIVRKHNLGGGTRYAPALRKIAEAFGNKGTPGYCLFVTDGNCDDRSEAEKVIKDLSHQPIFFQFIGVGNESFDFLMKLDGLKVGGWGGRKVDNAGFTPVRELTDLTYESLLNEFPKYLPAARAAGLLP